MRNLETISYKWPGLRCSQRFCNSSHLQINTTFTIVPRRSIYDTNEMIRLRMERII